MKKLLTITSVFNDVFTGYKDKVDTMRFIVDTEKDCTCNEDAENDIWESRKVCYIHDKIEGYTLSDLPASKPNGIDNPQSPSS